MKLYDSIGPNPKLVRMFAAEKGFAFSETEKVDIMAGANRQAPYIQRNPSGQMPAVELDGGGIVAETIAICELLEELQPAPALIGETPQQRAETRMWARRVECKIMQPLTDGFRNAEGIKMFQSRMHTDAAAAPYSKATAQEGLAWLNAQLEGRTTIVPGRFTMADVALYSILEFGQSVGQGVSPEHGNVKAWFDATAARESAKA